MKGRSRAIGICVLGIFLISALQTHLFSLVPQVDAEEKSNLLAIPSIGVNARVVETGINPVDGKMSVPDDYTTVGLYKDGAYPGENGTVVIAAHVDNGGSIDGVFKHLNELKHDDSVYFYTKEGKKLTYRVVEKKLYDRDEKNTEEVFNTPGSGSYLNIITCYGTWLTNENTYEQRLVVFTELSKAQ